VVKDLGSAVAQVARDPTALGRRVLIQDETGTHLPLGLAELPAAAGAKVYLLTA
jgi:hypothetical protein